MAYGQADQPEVESQIRERVAIVTDDFIDVRGGPARAYQSRGRLYRDERVKLRGESGQAWVMVVSGKVRGWVPISAFRFPRERIAPDTSVERRRRLSDFEYTDTGRRTHRGRASGSGEGTRTGVVDDEDITMQSVHHVQAGLSFGYGRIQRDFESNAVEASRLRQVNVNGHAFVSRLALHWQASPSFGLALAARDFRLASLPVDYGPDMGSVIDVDMDAQDVELSVEYGHRWSSVYAGLYGQLSWFRQGYREVEPLSVVLSTQSYNLGGGLTLAWATNTIDIKVRTGVAASASLDQLPLSSGSGSALLFRVSSVSIWWFSQTFGWAVELDFHQRNTDFSGDSTHIDEAVMGAPQNYTQAREKDGLMSASTGPRWRW